MTDRDRMIELFREMDKNPDITCPTPNDVETCKTCKYAIGEWLCDVEARKVDYLLANGVIVPPCKVGDKAWDLHQRYNGTFVIREGKISMLTQKADKSWHLRITVNSSVWGFTPNEIGTRYFLAKEDAEKKLKELGK